MKSYSVPILINNHQVTQSRYTALSVPRGHLNILFKSTTALRPCILLITTFIDLKKFYSLLEIWVRETTCCRYSSVHPSIMVFWPLTMPMCTRPHLLEAGKVLSQVYLWNFLRTFWLIIFWYHQFSRCQFCITHTACAEGYRDDHCYSHCSVKPSRMIEYNFVKAWCFSRQTVTPPGVIAGLALMTSLVVFGFIAFSYLYWRQRKELHAERIRNDKNLDLIGSPTTSSITHTSEGKSPSRLFVLIIFWIDIVPPSDALLTFFCLGRSSFHPPPMNTEISHVLDNPIVWPISNQVSVTSSPPEFTSTEVVAPFVAPVKRTHCKLTTFSSLNKF